MILGYNTNGFSSHSLASAIEIISEIGYRSIGITLDFHALDPYDSQWQHHCAEVRTKLESTNLVPVVETGARFLLDPRRKHLPNLLSEDESDQDRRIDFLCRSVDVAAEIGAKVVSLWSGAASCNASEEVLDTRLVNGLVKVCDKAASRGVVIGFEPEPGMHIESMQHFERIAGQFSHPAFALTLDLGHAHLTEDSVDGTIESYIGQIVNVHVEGMRRPNHDHLVPWDSGYDVKAALETLTRCGYKGPATLELSRSSHNAVQVARESFSFLG